MQKCNEFNEGIIKLAIIEYIRMIYGLCDVEMNKDSDSSKSGSSSLKTKIIKIEIRIRFRISYEILFYSVCIAL